jgi:hypothetical protein
MLQLVRNGDLSKACRNPLPSVFDINDIQAVSSETDAMTITLDATKKAQSKMKNGGELVGERRPEDLRPASRPHRAICAAATLALENVNYLLARRDPALHTR